MKPLPANAPYIKPGPKQNGMGAAPAYSGQPNSMNFNYKTAKCKYIEEGTSIFDAGQCRFGNKCIFAHGDGELRTPVDAG